MPSVAAAIGGDAMMPRNSRRWLGLFREILSPRQFVSRTRLLPPCRCSRGPSYPVILRAGNEGLVVAAGVEETTVCHVPELVNHDSAKIGAASSQRGANVAS